MRKGVVLGFILSIGAILANIIVNGFFTSYVYYSNYLLLIGTGVGLLGGILYVLYWINDLKLVKKIYYKEELPERREEIKYMKEWGSYLIIAMFVMWFVSLLFALPYYFLRE
ncbi:MULTISPECIES: hypothetical protein [Caldanaerobacter]|jgi:purine-cytosine permease-like protein|uniref:Uncharacterized protein n=1 Tax=Caldanaerobacter subterraneus TaxID=911092 RepID=A0A4R2KDS6_9THEO|nr:MULTISPECIES: hypothetical protein [Caldanaerobacter]MDI3518909.1 hypothetical protein [Caldanaerobacter sp.]MDK2793512.1 hypothetical protein [Caldanaerobacter sp.]TCO68038.1 hypothetical protein EV203_104125 [Caldanaerobacter subterraneus]